jgi:hypothetical protein
MLYNGKETYVSLPLCFLVNKARETLIVRYVPRGTQENAACEFRWVTGSFETTRCREDLGLWQLSLPWQTRRVG